MGDAPQAPDAPKEPPRRKPGRPKGLPKTGGRKKKVQNWTAPEVRAQLLPVTAQKLLKIIQGEKIQACGPTGKTRWQHPTVEQQLKAVEIALRKTLPDLSATHLSADVTKSEEPKNPRDVARAVLSIISEANIESKLWGG